MQSNLFNNLLKNMSDNKKVVEDKTKTEKTEQVKMQEFVQAYQKLCEEYGYQIVVTPAWKARDDGTFSLVQQTSIGKLPKQ